MVHILIKWSIDKRVIQVVLLFDIIFHLISCLVKKRASLLHFYYSNRERFIVLKYTWHSLKVNKRVITIEVIIERQSRKTSWGHVQHFKTLPDSIIS
jgi:hypothetical protein